MALDWSQCPAVASIPGKVSGAWVFKDTRTPVALIFENLQDGMAVDDLIEQFPITREQVRAVPWRATPEHGRLPGGTAVRREVRVSRAERRHRRARPLTAITTERRRMTPAAVVIATGPASMLQKKRGLP